MGSGFLIFTWLFQIFGTLDYFPQNIWWVFVFCSFFLLLFLWPAQVSGQEEFCQNPYQRKLLFPLWPGCLGITDDCQYITLCQSKKSGESHDKIEIVGHVLFNIVCSERDVFFSVRVLRMTAFQSLGFLILFKALFSYIHTLFNDSCKFTE